MSMTFEKILNLLYNSFLGPKVWDIVSIELKQLVTVNAFKGEIKKWKPVNCPCKLCRPYMQNDGFS